MDKSLFSFFSAFLLYVTILLCALSDEIINALKYLLFNLPHSGGVVPCVMCTSMFVQQSCLILLFSSPELAVIQLRVSTGDKERAGARDSLECINKKRVHDGG